VISVDPLRFFGIAHIVAPLLFVIKAETRVPLSPFGLVFVIRFPSRRVPNAPSRENQERLWRSQARLLFG
jgi:hypothetical protein